MVIALVYIIKVNKTVATHTSDPAEYFTSLGRTFLSPKRCSAGLYMSNHELEYI